MLHFCRSLTALVLLSAFVVTTQAQIPDEISLLLGGESRSQSSAGNTVPLEGIIDEEVYLVGPGDVFAVTVGGAQPQTLRATVTADGHVLFTEAGSILVADLSLRQATDRIQRTLSSLYTRVPVSVALAEPRRFFVHVSGSVPNPGRKAVGPVARLEDALVAASVADSLTRASYLRRGYLPALRRVEIERRSGEKATYDLVRYRRTGDLDHNPYLQDGDRIRVLQIRLADEAVYVSGDIAYPGPYAARLNDTVLDLLLAADGTLDPADERVVRVRGGPTYRIGDLVARPASAPSIAAGDQIFVESDPEQATVRLEGAVRFPGVYRIRQGITTVREIVEQAGGLRDEALVPAAYLERYGTGDPRAFTSALKSLTAPGDLPFVTRAALGDQFDQSTLAVPVGDILSGEAPDAVLYEGDRLVIPRDEQSVLIVGAVARPGYVPMRPGGRPRDYLEAAGGLRSNAQRVLIVKSGSRDLILAQDQVLNTGDVLVVTTDDAATRPELYGFALQEQQLALQERNARRDARFRALSTTLSVISTAVAVLTTYLTVRELK